MSRRVLARIKVMALTIMFIGGFSALNPACSQQTHAGAVETDAPAPPGDPSPRGQ